MFFKDYFKMIQQLEDKQISVYKELKMYCNYLNLELPTFTEFVELINKISSESQYSTEESIQIVANELMPYRYSYCDISQLGGVDNAN